MNKTMTSNQTVIIYIGVVGSQGFIVVDSLENLHFVLQRHDFGNTIMFSGHDYKQVYALTYNEFIKKYIPFVIFNNQETLFLPRHMEVNQFFLINTCNNTNPSIEPFFNSR